MTWTKPTRAVDSSVLYDFNSIISNVGIFFDDSNDVIDEFEYQDSRWKKVSRPLPTFKRIDDRFFSNVYFPFQDTGTPFAKLGLYYIQTSFVQQWNKISRP